jgi:hypothetical protein
MKKIFLMSILMLGLWGCKKEKEKEDDIEIFVDIPAIAKYNFSLEQPTLITPFDTFIAPQLLTDYAFYDLEGEPLLITYFINYDQQPFKEHTTLWGELLFTRLKKKLIQATDGGESEAGGYDVAIEKIKPYAMINNIAFFVFNHSIFINYLIYEMTYDPDDASDIPTVYFRAKESDKNDGIYPYEPFYYFCTFDLNDFLVERRKTEKKIKVNIKFKTGTDNGKDVYKNMEGSPLELTFR